MKAMPHAATNRHHSPQGRPGCYMSYSIGMTYCCLNGVMCVHA